MYVKGSESFHPEIIGHVIFCTQFARSILLQILKSTIYGWCNLGRKSQLPVRGKRGCMYMSPRNLSIPLMEGICFMTPHPSRAPNINFQKTSVRKMI